MKKKVAIYARVSTNQQDTENQILELRRYVQARGWETTEFVDQGFSGIKSEDQRPALKSLMKTAMKREIDAVIVWDFSRFARSMRQLVNALDTFKELGISFISIREGIDTTTANGRLVFGIFAALSEFERNLIRDRVVLGLKRAKALGRHPGPKRKSVDLEKLHKEAGKGLSLRSLSKNFGVSKDTISKLLKQRNSTCLNS